MKKTALTFGALILLFAFGFAQAPKLYIHFVSHNEPGDSLNQPLRYARAKNHALQMANLVNTKNVKWNLQTSDGFVLGARQDELSTGSNIFKTLASAPYNDNIEIDPRSKNSPGRNIADQWYLLDSIGAHPSKTVGGFIYHVCNGSPLSIDWWQYQDTLTGQYYGNKIKFNLLSGAGSLPPHCNDLNDFGVFKPDTTNNFYNHNSSRNLWCLGTGCAPLLDSMKDELAIIEEIKGQVDSIQKGLWPPDKFYITRIMTNQREYGPMFFEKVARVMDSINAIPATKIQWANITEAFAAFQAWSSGSGKTHSQWRCGETRATGLEENKVENSRVFPNPSAGKYQLHYSNSGSHDVCVYDILGKKVFYLKSNEQDVVIDLTQKPTGLYLLEIDSVRFIRLVKE